MFRALCNVVDLPLGQKRLFEVEDVDILLFHLEDGFYATQAKCPHLFKSMVKGKVEDDQLICPMHRATFDIRTGESIRWANFPPGVQLLNKVRPERALKTYKVLVEGGVVSVELDDEAS